MGTSSFNKLATSTATLLRGPAIIEGKRGKRTSGTLDTFPCTPPDTMDASLGFGFGIENPHSVWAIYTEGTVELQNGDVIEINDIQYLVKNVRVFPHFRRSGNTSYEVQLEINEDENKRTE